MKKIIGIMMAALMCFSSFGIMNVGATEETNWIAFETSGSESYIKFIVYDDKDVRILLKYNGHDFHGRDIPIINISYYGSLDSAYEWSHGFGSGNYYTTIEEEGQTYLFFDKKISYTEPFFTNNVNEYKRGNERHNIENNAVQIQFNGEIYIFDANFDFSVYGDFNKDNIVNSSDAAFILIYAAAHGAGSFNGTFEEYIAQN